MINYKYTRVLPRDLFNEAKLLKCIGQLVLKIHDRQCPCIMGLIEDHAPFKIGLLEEGALCIGNLDLLIKGIRYPFKTTYNSKANYPLYVSDIYDYVDYLVFDEEGNWTEEFVEFTKTIIE